MGDAANITKRKEEIPPWNGHFLIDHKTGKEMNKISVGNEQRNTRNSHTVKQ